jgi:hypothetical protein
MPPGRVVRLSDGAVGQVAVIGDAPDGVAQVGALLSLAQQVGGGPGPSAEAPPGGPWTVRRLPCQVSLADLPQSVVPDPPMGSVDGEVTRSAGGLVTWTLATPPARQQPATAKGGGSGSARGGWPS